MNADIHELRHVAEHELGVVAKLHDYQWEGVAFLCNSTSALLADDMGLGKTVQTVVALSVLLRRDPRVSRALVVAPAALVPNWSSEFRTWSPSISVGCLGGDLRDREALYLLPLPVLVASYEQIRTDSLDHIPSGTFDVVVLDEAQRIKNRRALTALACKLLPRQRSWALSATPLENSEDDIRSILEFVDPGGGSRSGNSISRDLARVMLRRRKADVRSDLPPVILQDLPLQLNAEQRSAYDELWRRRVPLIQETMASQEIGAALLGLMTRLKVVCNFHGASGTSSKHDALACLIESAGGSARILVFSQFVETLEWLSGKLSVPHEMVTGSMPIDSRQSAIRRFRTGASPRALLISLLAGGVGLNLGEASHVVLFDRWWNPSTEIQAIYRAHRFSRLDPLHVVRFRVMDSIEEHIQSILDRKAELFDRIVDSADAVESRLTREQLLRILDVSPEDLGLDSGPQEHRDGEDT